MHLGELQSIISIFVSLNLQVIATGQDVERNFSPMDGQTSEQDDNDNEDCMKCGLGVIDREGRVVNGEEVKPLNKYPWIVPLNLGKRTVCGGALISRTFILTAAHCIFNAQKSKFPECIGYSPANECSFQKWNFPFICWNTKNFDKNWKLRDFFHMACFNTILLSMTLL
ncbi:hypothetical protein NPIL_107301 [Nephila pilipes]|uniref:Peptidase S1 domain-containing protein n=1 Tax=Nephila pilipes TaxID=299642 RepID=A0A8X6N7Y7_NEPPI|nr:hypothetical protein NPIL_107301 [Nephila pilipes]